MERVRDERFCGKNFLQIKILFDAVTDPRSSDFEANLLFSKYKATLDIIEMKVRRRILNSPDIVAAVDRHRLSPYAFRDVFAAIVGANGGNVNDFVLSTSTSSGTIKKVDTEMLNNVKRLEGFSVDEFVSIGWDEKMIQEGKDFAAFEHITFLSSHCNKLKCWGLPL